MLYCCCFTPHGCYVLLSKHLLLPSFLFMCSLKYNGTEPYSSFLARIMFHYEKHLPGPNITVDTVTSGAGGEKMMNMMMDLAVKEWLEKIHPSLIDKVKFEYGVQIKSGIRISALAPQIAKAIPGFTQENDKYKK